MSVRLANAATDFWELDDGEALNLAHPSSFWIPMLPERMSLRRGQAAQLIFKLTMNGPDGLMEKQDRMWVVVSEHVDGKVIGILTVDPPSIVPSDTIYLRKGAEIPFEARHVINIDWPPLENATRLLGEPRTRTWPR